jgi:hypothetical protein
VRFDYYRRLSPELRRVYDKSDALGAIPLPGAAAHQKRARELEQALEGGDRKRVQEAAQALARGITLAMGCPGVTVRVRAKRPKNHSGELHGLYTRESDGRSQIEVWMRTAEHERVVAFRTFLRTLLHEICHHLDFVHFGFPETFHNEGFFRRESSLTRQIARRGAARRRPAPAKPKPSPNRSEKKRGRPRQLSLFA